MKKIFRRLVFAFQFMTAIPIPIELYVDEEDMAGSVPFFPLTGLLVGAVCVFVGLLMRLIADSDVLWAATVMITGFFLSGGLHADGLADTFDGLFSHKPREQMLEIMKDSRIGTFGAAALIMDFLWQFAVLMTLYQRNMAMASAAVIIAHVAGRTAMSVSAAAGQYARANGLARGFIGLTGWRHGLWASVIAAAIFFAFMLLGFWIPLLLAVGMAMVFTLFMSKRLGGITGDTLGALNQIVYAAILLSFVWQPLRWTL